MSPEQSASMQALAAAIRSARERSGDTPESLAARSGIELADYHAIERGEHEATLETIVCVAAALGMTSADLLGRAEL